MSTQTELSCPVDFIAVNENKVRLIALQVFVIGILILVFTHWALVAFLAVDFLLRSVNLNRFSPLGWIASGIIKILSIATKPIDQAPKRFAARIGLLFTVSMLISSLAGYETAVFALTSVLIVFAFLESFLSICAGCYVYTYYRKLF